MCGYGYGQANPAILKWRNNSYIGKRIMHFSHSNYGKHKIQIVPDISYIVKDEKGFYGFVGGGNNNIGSFINWCSGLGAWCFNPWTDRDDYFYSEINEAFMHKSKLGLRNIRVLVGKFYKADFDSDNNIIRLYNHNWPQEEILWEKE